MWNQGVHSRSGVACADCNMPYMPQGGLRISDHQVNSPLLKINRSCQTCHHFPEEELKARVETIQERHFNLRNIAMDALVDLINDLKSGISAGKSDGEICVAIAYPPQGRPHFCNYRSGFISALKLKGGASSRAASIDAYPSALGLH